MDGTSRTVRLPDGDVLHVLLRHEEPHRQGDGQARRASSEPLLNFLFFKIRNLILSMEVKKFVNFTTCQLPFW